MLKQSMTTKPEKVSSSVAGLRKFIDHATLFQSLNTPYIVFATDDPDFTVIEQNEAHARTGGIPRSQAIGRPLREALPETSPELRESTLAVLSDSIRQVIKDKKPHSLNNFRYDMRDKSGKFVTSYWSLIHRPVFDDAHRVIAVYQEAKDITEQDRAEAARVENEKRMRFIADSIPQLSWIARPDGYREYYNKQWFDFTGSSPEESVGDGWQKLVHPEDKERVIAAWEHSYKTGEKYEVEYRLYHAPSNSYRWFIGRALPYRDDSGKIVNWYGTSTDIHEQKRTAETQQFLADISKELASSLDYTKMLKKVTKLCVPAIADWCSIDIYNEKDGFNQVSLAHADARKVTQAREYRRMNPISLDQPTGVARVLQTGEPEFYPYISNELLEQSVEDAELLEFMKSLNLRSIIIAPLRISGEVVGGISFVLSDSERYYDEQDLRMAEELAGRISIAISNSKLYDDSIREIEKRERAERELLREKQTLEARVQARTEQRVQHLVELNRSKDEFISIASHQLRTPATGVKQYVGMLIEGFAGDLTPKQERLLEKAYENNERQLKIVTDLLRVAQVDAGKVVLRKSEVELNAFIDDIIRDHHGVFSNRHQTIRYQPLHPDVTIMIDEASVRMVLENLIDNASKYSEEHTHVEVVARDEQDAVTINVRDEGVGIDPEGRTRLFEKFSRINNSLSMKVGGTGLGLYWAKKIVDLHGGKITYRSHPSGGTTFSIKLPKK
jgi:PAS domain S-box-containing protein